MSEDILKKIQYLIDKEIGDTGRLYHIKDSLEKGKILYLSDQRYLQTMISKHTTSSTSETSPKVLPKSDKQIEYDTYQRQNLEEEKISGAVDKPRHELEYDIQSKLDEMDATIKKHESKPKPSEYKSEGTTLVLSIVVGLFGIMGVGHLYVGKIRRGIIIMVIGFSLWTVVFIPFLFLGIGNEIEQSITEDIEFLQYSDSMPQKDTTAVLIGFVIAVVSVSIGYLVLYIWQILDSRKLCKRYNQYLEQEGKPLW